MELRLLLILLLSGLIACKSGVNTDSSTIGKLSKILSENPSKENRDALIAAYQDTIKADPNNSTANSAFFQDLAKLHVDNKAYVFALQTIMQSIQDYPAVNGVAEKVWMLGEIYERNMQRQTVANIVKKLYAQKFPSGANVAAAKQVLTNNAADIATDIANLGNSMYDEKTHKVDFQAANDYIRICELFALLQPKDSKSPEYLHKAGETARAVRAFPQAVAIYDKIYSEYPNYEKAAQALFLKAFTYDNDLGDKATAKALYEEFLQKYPSDDFADDTQFLLSNLGKNDEEIIKGFGQQ